MTTRRTVLITGGLGDIGRGLAREFARNGANVAFCDLQSEEQAKEFSAELSAGGGGVRYRRVDVTQPDQLLAFTQEVAREFGGLDICIANAGIVERGELVDFSPEQWRRVLDVNLTGAFLTAQAAARVMLEGARGGHIVFMSSWTQDHPRAGIGGYCASKSGLKMLAKCLALELGPRGIRVNVVAPGWVDAGLTSHNIKLHPELRSEMESQIPLGRLIPAEELAGLVRLLCSEEARYLTGTTMLVDGGSSLILRKPRI
jgi:NAD(P)-dependent dehydrogenase (short-subunit alcohol dehydrogenase family)